MFSVKFKCSILLVVCMMAPVFSQGQLAIIDITSRNLVGDANIENKPDDGPEVFTVGGDFRNNGIDTLKHVYVTIGDGTNAGIFPETIVPPGGDYEGTFSLRLLDNDTEDAERYLGHLLPGEQKSVYWEIVYPLLDAAGHAVWGDPNDSDDDLKLKFTIWGNCIEASSQSPQSVSLNDSVYVRNEQKAATSKIQPTPDGYYTIVAGPNLSPGQTVTVTYNNVSFGNVNQGFDVDGYPGPDYDLWYQPIGELDWDPSVFRLVRTSATIHGSQCGAGRPDVDIFLSDSTYISKLDQYGSCGWEGSYEYTFAAIGLGSCTLTPYQEVASGSDNEKYNSDYGGDDLAGCDYCVTLTSQEGGLEFSKNVDKMYALDGDTLTYTIILFNNSSLPVGDPDLSIFPIVTDSIPLLGFYLSSSIQTFLDCITLYSVDNGQTWLTEEPAPGTGITHLRWTINQQFLPGQIDSIQFKFIINQDLSDTIVNYADLSFMGEIPVQIDSAVTFVNQLGHITGQVWIDENQNGIRETVENATPPTYQVTLLDGGAGVVSSIMTSLSGVYEFSSVPFGNYSIQITPILYFGFSPKDQGGNDLLDSDIDPMTGQTDIFIVDAAQSYVFDAGILVLDSDNDFIPDSTEVSDDRDDDDIVNYLDFDPTGYLYDEVTGQILSGGSVLVTGPGVVTLIHDGSAGFYQFITDGTPGLYTIQITPPPNYFSSLSCTAESQPLDPTGQTNPVVLGNGEDGNTGFLTSNACTPFYYTYNYEPDDPTVINNNFPFYSMVPVELFSFTASCSKGVVFLEWITQSESENLGFFVYRSLQPNSGYEKITPVMIRGAGSSAVNNKYTFTDKPEKTGCTYYYKLADISFNGEIKYHNPIAIEVKKPLEYRLEQNYPNPFNPVTTISYSLKQAGFTRLLIYNMKGQMIRDLISDVTDAGEYDVEWDGRDNNGHIVPSGTYLYRLQVHDFCQTRKMLLLK